MAPRFVFADEAGCFTFKRQSGASNYFLLCTLSTDDCTLAHELLDIRRHLAVAGDAERDKLHATADLQATRDKVFGVLAKHEFRVDATILEKCKAQPHTRTSEPTFYQYAWYYHLKHVAPILLRDADKLLITAAALGSKKTRAAFKQAVNNTMQQITPREKWEVSFMDSSKDPLLWAADYCAWAIQRKWERGDTQSHALIATKIVTEYDLWTSGQTTHYQKRCGPLVLADLRTERCPRALSPSKGRTVNITHWRTERYPPNDIFFPLRLEGLLRLDLHKSVAYPRKPDCRNRAA